MKNILILYSIFVFDEKLHVMYIGNNKLFQNMYYQTKIFFSIFVIFCQSVIINKCNGFSKNLVCRLVDSGHDYIYTTLLRCYYIKIDQKY